MSGQPYPIEQALVHCVHPQVILVARSSGFLPDWQTEVTRICRGFGRRPSGAPCPDAIFALPFNATQVCVAQVRELSAEPSGLAFRFLIIGRDVYADRIGDPFAVTRALPADWEANGELPPLCWPREPLPYRRVTDIQLVLQTGGSPTLLGTVQALIDGSRVCFVRPQPEADLVSNVWQLLPDSSRAELWPASFAFAPDLGFDLVVMPAHDGTAIPAYLTEERVLEYPSGRYELALQIAVEAGDQREMDRLFSRRSSRQTLRLALVLLGGAVLFGLVMKLLNVVPIGG